MRSISNLIRDFLPPVSGQTMHDDDFWISIIYKGSINLIGWKNLLSDPGLFFLTHARPGICVYHLGTLHSLLRVFYQFDLAAACPCQLCSNLHGTWIDLVSFRPGE